VIHDRDSIFSKDLDRGVKAMGVRWTLEPGGKRVTDHTVVHQPGKAEPRSSGCMRSSSFVPLLQKT
jgi:hypothetical protein